MRLNSDDKRAERESSGLLPLFSGVVLALAVLVQLAPEKRIDFAQAGLGIGTEESFGEEGATRYHCSSVDDVRPCIQGMMAHADNPQVLWLGASQLHAINNPQPGDTTVVAKVHDRLLDHGAYVSSVSLANANLQELYIVFEHIKQATNVDVLVVGMVYDDMREAGVRETVASALRNARTVEALQGSTNGWGLVGRFANTQKPQSDDGEITELETPQKIVEKHLDTFLADTFNVWSARADFRGNLFTEAFDFRKRLLMVRNQLLGIDSTKWWVRIDPGQYALNRKALDALLDSAKRSGVSVLLYIAPRPIDAHFPYDLAGYEGFKNDVADLAGRYGAQFVNLEDAVKGDVWGTIDNGVGEIVTDIFHFMNSGHEQMADSVSDVLLPIVQKEMDK